jgi:hypothetical protein
MYERGVDNYDYTELEKKAVKAAALMTTMLQPLQASVDIANIALVAARSTKECAQTALANFKSTNDVATDPPNRGRCGVQSQEYRSMSNPNRRLDAIEVAATEERTTLENDLAAVDAVLTRKPEDLASVEEKLSAAKDGKPITK